MSRQALIILLIVAATILCAWLAYHAGYRIGSH